MVEKNVESEKSVDNLKMEVGKPIQSSVHLDKLPQSSPVTNSLSLLPVLVCHQASVSGLHHSKPNLERTGEIVSKRPDHSSVRGLLARRSQIPKRDNGAGR